MTPNSLLIRFPPFLLSFNSKFKTQNSKFLSILILPLLLLSGCTTAHNQIFHGRLENLAGDGWVEQGTRLANATSSQPGPDNGRILALSLSPDASFILWHPTNPPGKTVHAH